MTRYYDFWDQRWVFPAEPVPLDSFRLRLSHGLDVANTILVIVVAFRLADAQRHFWTTILASWVEGAVGLEGQAGRRKVGVSPRLYWIDAWDRPYDGHELESVGGRIGIARELLGAQAKRNEKTDEQVADEIRCWHGMVAETIGKSSSEIRNCAYGLWSSVE